MTTGDKEDMPIGKILDPTQSLITLMWLGQDAARKTESSVVTWLTILVAIGSALIGAGIGGFTSYWYSREDPNLIVIAAYIMLTLAAFVLLVYVCPRTLDKMRSRLQQVNAMEFIRDAKETGLIDNFVEEAVKHLMETKPFIQNEIKKEV